MSKDSRVFALSAVEKHDAVQVPWRGPPDWMGSRGDIGGVHPPPKHSPPNTLPTSPISRRRAIQLLEDGTACSSV